MKVPFKYYLHDNYDHSERVTIIEEQTGVKITEMMADRLGRPFYEVTLRCLLDDDTGEVTILGIEQ